MKRAAKSRARPHRVVMLGFPQAQVLDITGPLEVFSRTTRWLAEHRGTRTPAYTTELVAARAGPFATSGGLQLVATRRYADAGPIDTLLIAGGIGFEPAAKDQALLRWISAQSRRVDRLGSICNGAMILAAAGLLDGKPATTHWAYLDRLAKIAPKASIERDALYVRAGNIYTSAGVTAGMDLALALVEQDHGKAVALAVAQELVLFLKRPGGQSQFSRYLEAQKRDDLFGELELWMLEHPGGDLSVGCLARRMSMSPVISHGSFACDSGRARRPTCEGSASNRRAAGSRRAPPASSRWRATADLPTSRRFAAASRRSSASRRRNIARDSSGPPALPACGAHWTAARRFARRSRHPNSPTSPSSRAD